jgi:preprotein translocase subunit SecF
MIQIIKNRKISFSISAVFFLISLVLISTLGLKLGIDFTGGSLMEFEFTGVRPTVQEMQATLAPLDLGDTTVQPVEDQNMILKTKFVSEDEHQEILSTVRGAYEVTAEDGSTTKVLEERIETIGPAISTYLREKAWKAALTVMIAIILFIAYAFRKVSKPIQSWKYGLTAIVALIHDITITMGIFALLGHYLGVEVNIPFIVALLTILGYSVNDTIVVFDRVRENLIKRGSHEFSETVNMGINQTLVRSVNTSVTTLLVLFALFIFGGDSIKYFSLALIVGIALGTYSSLFLASPLLIEWERATHKE